MIPVPHSLDPPGSRLLGALASTGQLTGGSHPATIVASTGLGPDPALSAMLQRARDRGDVRVLVLSVLGVHPDARTPRLRELWEIEETARESGLPVLTLRLAPIIGPHSPLWMKLRSRPRLGPEGNTLLNPVAESDVVETLAKAFREEGDWSGWYEVAGEEVLTLAELAALAQHAGPALPEGAGAWEPALREMAEARLADPAPWRQRFDLRPVRVIEQAGAWNLKKAPAHRAVPARAADCVVVTVSDTRTAAEDRSGDVIVTALERAGHRVRDRVWVKDEVAEIRKTVRAVLARRPVDAVLLTGGTGVSPRDRTPEALKPLLAQELPGFGELFRMLSYRQVGSAAWLSRAGAGVSKGKLVVWLPGSTRAVELAMARLVVPELSHALRLLGLL